MPRLLWPLVMMSGASALIYEIVWLRRAALHLGATGTALGIVIATFLGGLAVGAALGGRWADRNPARLVAGYAVIELFIAVSGLLAGPLLELLARVLGGLYTDGGDGGILFNAGRAVVCVLVLLPPATAMGATLPVLARQAAAISGNPAVATGAIYAANTLGAVLGSFAAGWLLIPRLGLTGATVAAAASNITVAAGAFFLSKRAAPLPPAAEEPPTTPPRWIYPAYALSGIAALICEVAWTRGLILAFGSSVHAFSIVLGSFILGLALGGALSSQFLPRVKNPGAAFGALLVTSGVLTALTVPMLEGVPANMMSAWAEESHVLGIAIAEFSMAVLIVAVPAMTMGAMFPLLCKLAMGEKPAAGRAIGRLAAWNTAGNIIGTLAASFALVPWLGVDRALLVAAGISLFVAGAVFFLSGWRRASAAPVALVLVLFVVPRWDLELVTSNPAVYGKLFVDYSKRNSKPLADMLTDDELLFSRWDSTGLVTVHKRDSQVTLRVNGKAEASSSGDMLTQILLSHLPLIVHEAPRDVLVVGYGSGTTAAAALKHDITTLDCLEISPAIVEAADYFAEGLAHPRRDNRLRLSVGDARAHIRNTRRMYDVIISQPSNLWISGTGTLFTKEHFDRCRERLKPGGVMCQWVHGYRLPTPDFLAVVATFRAAFPETALWEVSVGNDFLLLGSATPIPELRPERYETVKAALKQQGVFKLEALGRCRVTGTEGIASLGAGARLITDDDCHVEYSAPAGLVAVESAAVLDHLAPLRKEEGRRLLALAVRAARDQRHEESVELLNRALVPSAFDPARLGAIEAISRLVYYRAADEAAAGRTDLARRLFAGIPEDSRIYETAQGWVKRLGGKP